MAYRGRYHLVLVAEELMVVGLARDENVGTFPDGFRSKEKLLTNFAAGLKL